MNGKPEHSTEQIFKWFEQSIEEDNKKRDLENQQLPKFKKGEGVEDVPAATDDSI